MDMKFEYRWTCNGKSDKGTTNAMDEGSAILKIQKKAGKELKVDPDRVNVVVYQVC